MIKHKARISMIRARLQQQAQKKVLSTLTWQGIASELPNQNKV